MTKNKVSKNKAPLVNGTRDQDAKVSNEDNALYHPQDFANPFDIDPEKLPVSSTFKPLLKTFFPGIKYLLGISELAEHYTKIPAWRGSENFFKTILDYLKIKYEVFPSPDFKLPQNKPLIIVSNHPFGALEALIMYEVIKPVRPDVKFLANFLLGRLAQVKDLFILVDPFERQSAKKGNVHPMRNALSWLKDGHCLITFPAGTVSHYHPSAREVQDPEWNTNIARLVRKTNATVLPCFIHGRNSSVFQIVGMIHPLLRTILLPRQLLNKKNKKIAIQIGSPVTAEKLSRFDSDRELTDYLRMRCYLQKNSPILRFHDVKNRTKSPISSSATPVIEAVKPAVLEKEFNAIAKDLILIERNNLAVGLTTFEESPNLLKETGRLREITFREVGEGTGTECDLDFFDNFYKHLICWDREKSKIVGAYRLIKTNEAVQAYGMRGLYTNTLFHYDKNLLRELGPSVEVGRSFVAPDYQRTLWPLLLLLKGLGTYVARNPDHKTLFGPVSVSNSFTGVSRHLLELFLRENNFQANLAQHVKPRLSSEPERVLGVDQKFFSKTVKDISEVSELIEDIELKEQGVPVLLKEYTKLGGKIIGFNVDPEFSGVLDGLIVVDMSKAEKNLLHRYLGEEETVDFLKHHNL